MQVTTLFIRFTDMTSMKSSWSVLALWSCSGKPSTA